MVFDELKIDVTGNEPMKAALMLNPALKRLNPEIVILVPGPPILGFTDVTEQLPLTNVHPPGLTTVAPVSAISTTSP
jgi:hypothetical protein